MRSKDWPLNTPYKLSPEDEAYFEELVAKLDRGELKFRPLNDQEKTLHRKIALNPVTTSVERCSEDTFNVTMMCHGCGARDQFDQTAPKPWRKRAEDFEQFHKNHTKPERTVRRKHAD